MGLFSKNSKVEEVVHPDTILLRYAIRKLGNVRTDAEIDARITSLRASQAADTQRRLHEEERVQRQEEAVARASLARRERALKYLGRLRVHLCPTSHALSGNARVVTIGSDMTVKCPECNTVIDISEQCMHLADRLEEKGSFIDGAIANPTDSKSVGLIVNSIIRVNHNSVYGNNMQCSTIIEVFIDGARICGQKPAPRVR